MDKNFKILDTLFHDKDGNIVVGSVIGWKLRDAFLNSFLVKGAEEHL